MPWTPHVLLRWGGPLGDDTWSCGLRLAATPDSLDTNAIVDEAAELVKSFHADTRSMHNGLAYLSWVKLNRIGGDGRYIDKGATTLQEIEPAISPPIRQNHAPQLAIAVTLRTAITRGRAHAGRIYIPARAVAVDARGTFPTATATDLATATALFIREVNVLMGDVQGRPAVRIFSSLDGSNNAVTRVECGNVFDTQRRRRAQVLETYFGADI